MASIPRRVSTNANGAPGGARTRWAVAASAVVLMASLSGCLDRDAAEDGATPSASASPRLGTPEEVVTGIVDLIDSTESYLVDLDAEVTVGEGTYEQHETYALSTDSEPVFQFFEKFPESQGNDAYETAWLRVGEDGRILYRTDDDLAPREDRYFKSQQGDFSHLSQGPDYTLSRDAVRAPFSDLADTISVTEENTNPEGKDSGGAAARYSGTFDLTAPARQGDKPSVQENVPFELWVDEHGRPTRFDYELVTGPRSWTYQSFDTSLTTRYCGTVEGAPYVDTARVAPTNGEISCDDAVAVVEKYLAMPDEKKEGTGYLAEIGGWTCGIRTRADIQVRGTEDVASCSLDWPEMQERVDLLRTG
ncbi:hypothetical protein CDO52_05925 [Nocardiopsis gilva YIM 90087]|uniref:Uncharacterized protein n=1 Tax=Nocardiopsis gilva YIM 90087 TaxID=1235441 RepID=A0A223S2Y9_9ACTN|nr:hypothetical protein [Nocardiopsis gilva]ASU82389.1 hypothetical protein CDO52_05925 [Nocardiopsis gilva YIM 90087]